MRRSFLMPSTLGFILSIWLCWRMIHLFVIPVCFAFRVTLYNLNYNIPVEGTEKQFVDIQQTVHWTKKQSVEQSIHELVASNPIKDKLFKLFKVFEFDEPFSRADMVEMFGITTTPANALLRKFKNYKKLTIRANMV